VVAPRRPRPPELQTISAHWQRALDAAERALDAAGGTLPATDIARRRYDLVRERQQVEEALVRLADVTGARPMPWLSPVPVNNTMLGLPTCVRACLFDVEGVLTDSAGLHAWAWGEVFDDLMLRLNEKPAGTSRGVLSASAATLPMLELAGLAALVEERVDADAITAGGLRSRPAPDQLLFSCRRLGVRPEDAVTLTHSAAVAAGHAARVAVIGVGDGVHTDLLRGFGAERVVPSLGVLLDARLSERSDSGCSRRP
jgi:beta-phosphoglucomutase-like phosphatase (HAD superfamily)